MYFNCFNFIEIIFILSILSISSHKFLIHVRCIFNTWDYLVENLLTYLENSRVQCPHFYDTEYNIVILIFRFMILYKNLINWPDYWAFILKYCICIIKKFVRKNILEILFGNYNFCNKPFYWKSLELFVKVEGHKCSVNSLYFWIWCTYLQTFWVYL